MKRFEVSYGPAAYFDFADLHDLILAKTSQATARRFVEQIQAKCESLADAPFRGTIRDDLGPDLRTFGFKRRVTILIRVDKAGRRVVVLGVFYGGREVCAPEE